MKERARKQVCCRICQRLFLRFSGQPEGSRGWLCSAECRKTAFLQTRNNPCRDCGKLLAYKRKNQCSECEERARIRECPQCQRQFKKTESESPFCGAECAKIHRRKHSKSWGECKWCGKEFKRYTRATGERMGGMFCSLHCRHSSRRLKDYVRQKSKSVSRAMRRRARGSQGQKAYVANGQRNKTIDECRLATLLARLELHTRCRTEEELWWLKIQNITQNQRHREKIADKKHRADWSSKDRNRLSDWKHGGAWGRIVYLELKRLSRLARQTTEAKWATWIRDRLSSQRQRMKRKKQADCRHGS
jgi:hypothetical protein